jgi:ArsR family transcriptional regulator, arsenate/arsenite/antimonite-responsive transcriptional repressor
MKSKSAVAALSALAQENRLAVFRALVEAGPPGLCPSELTDTLGVAAPTLSFHLAQLRHAGLVRVTREGRTLHYAANFNAMNALIAFLTENCCGGDAVCSPVQCSPLPKMTKAVDRRRVS